LEKTLDRLYGRDFQESASKLVKSCVRGSWSWYFLEMTKVFKKLEYLVWGKT
jgi:hypothetical protein